MFSKCARQLTDSLVNNGVIPSDDYEVHCFGLESGFSIAANILTTLLVGFFFHMPLESILFLAAFIPLRSYTGGYHASGYFRCYWLSVLIIAAVLTAIRLILPVYSAVFILSTAAFCVTVMLVTVPVQDANRPLDDVEIKVYRHRARIVLGIEFCAMTVFSVSGFRNIAVVIFCVLCLACLTACTGLIKNYLRTYIKTLK